jgi:GNAT superfamily N-acetyltransferase
MAWTAAEKGRYKAARMPSIPGRYEIGSARIEELAELPQIEIEAGSIFPAEDLAPELRDDVHERSFFEGVFASGRLWVARCSMPPLPVGFAAATLVDGSAHLSEMDVVPGHARQGLGRGLVLEVARWACESGFASLTLTTFSHLAWNAPFYARLGFSILGASEQGPELRQVLEEEAAEGLDPAKRVAMRLDPRTARHAAEPLPPGRCSG